jgi:polyphenol oxidase
MADESELSDLALQVKSLDTRRRFLQKAGMAAGGLTMLGLPFSSVLAQEPVNCTPPASTKRPLPFTPDPTLRILPRKSVSQLDAAEVERYKAAYAKLRELTKSKPNDPRGWMQQANVHCWYCGGGQNGQAGSEIHGSWYFFPWHRCYLYYHERILAKLVGDPTFRLAYWDWSNPSDRTLPAPFRTPNSATNALFDAKRGVSATDQIPSQYVGAAAMQQILGTKTTSVFMGSSVNGGNLENGPHGLVHIFVGDPTLQDANIDMGVLSTAAQDPVFFTHHSNIDRYWDVWLRLGSGRKNPTSSTWLNRAWTFYDENAVLRSIKVSDVLSFEQNLRYTYNPILAVRANLPPVAAEAVTLGPDPVTRRVQVDPRLMAAVAGMPLEALAAPSPSRSVVLHIEGVEAPSTESAVVHVFGNAPGATASTSFDSPNFLGFFVIVPHNLREAGHQHQPRHIELEISSKIAEIMKDTNQMEVTLVPAAGGGVKPKNLKLSFNKIYVAQGE